MSDQWPQGLGGMAPERRRVLVTHADEPIGRRIVKRLLYDENVDSVVAVGQGPAPHAFARFLTESKRRLRYESVDLTRHRPVAELFHAASHHPEPIDSVIHVPRHGPTDARERPIVAGVAERTAEARMVLQQCLQSRSVQSLVALGSAFIYRLTPGNSNRLTEESELNLDPEAPAELRSWIDCDMIFHGEMSNRKLRVVLLRLPTVVASGGAIFLNPVLPTRAGGFTDIAPELRPAGFDPMCALVSDKDVAAAVRQALHAPGAGVYNIAGRETLPLSVLSRWAGRWQLPLPGPLLAGASTLNRWVGGGLLRPPVDASPARHGFTLDTRRAEEELGFRPGYRIGLARASDGRVRIETPAL